MKTFARALLRCKSFKDRQECLSDSLDSLSLNFPDLYFQLYKEMKRRELESNDYQKINKWLKSPPSHSYIKLHGALMLVKSHNIIVKDEYLDSVRTMLCETIKNGTNLEIAKKICRLIEKSPHLKFIYQCLFNHIQHVKKLIKNLDEKTLAKNVYNGNINFRQPKRVVDGVSQQHYSVCPTMLPTNCSKMIRGFSHFNFQRVGYDYLEQMPATDDKRSIFDISLMFSKLTIVSQEMDEVVAKWLYYLKLHNYQWFFNELSYLEIEYINEDNIEEFISKVNRNSITKGAQKKICISTKVLRERKQKFQDILLALDLEVTPNELCQFITYMRDVLHYPIPNKNCVIGDQLQRDIILIMEKFLNLLLEKLNGVRCLIAPSLLENSINKYLECSILVTSNQMFVEEQIDKMKTFSKTLKFKVKKMLKNFD